MLTYTSLLLASLALSIDVPTARSGEQDMIRSLRAVIQSSARLQDKLINLGVGSTGCEAFKSEAQPRSLNVFMTWQWLDCMKQLAPGTVVVVPTHVIDADMKSLAASNHWHIVPISGVLHSKSMESLGKASVEKIEPETKLILMLAGDTQQPDGTIKPYTAKMATDLIAKLPENAGPVLILNGPRTGQHQSDDHGQLVIDQTAHRTATDHVTKAALESCHEHKLVCHLHDFRFGQPSSWDSALSFALRFKVPLVLPGESTSMISEALGLGLRPSIAVHEAMTDTSTKYVKELVGHHQATVFPNIPDDTIQPAVPLQQEVVAEALVSIVGQDSPCSETQGECLG